MKNIFLAVFTFLISVAGFSNTIESSYINPTIESSVSKKGLLKPAKIVFSSKKISENIYEISARVKLIKHWHIFSSVKGEGDGPIVTEFNVFDSSKFEYIGGIKEFGEKQAVYDSVFETMTYFFEEEAVFTRRVKVEDPSKPLQGELYCQVCEDACILINPLFKLDLKTGVNLLDKNATVTLSKNINAKVKKSESSPTEVKTPENTLPTAIIDFPSEEEEFSAERVEEEKTTSEEHQEKEVNNPVNFMFSSKKIEGNVYEISAKLKIIEHWHVFSSEKYESLDAPLAAEFIVFDSTEFEYVGELQEHGEKLSVYDSTIELMTHYYENEVVFTRKIKVKNTDKPIQGEFYGQTCRTTCILINPRFKIDLKTGQDLLATTVEKENEFGDCEPKEFNGEKKEKEKESLIGMFILAFLFGLTTLLTPCVFPMIPMTVSFFMKDKGKGIRNAIIFGLSIIFIYTLVGTLVSIFFGADFSNWLATHWFPNVLFFLVFVIFAASFFGMFEITMPSWIVNKADKGADRAGLMGVFFMALTLVVVSFSCTGPIVGIILIDAAQGAVLEPMIGMLGFSLAFAIPFTIFAIFPSLLNRLPQSGGWLNSVKVVLGFIELALALKFLSVADQTYHWGLLDRHIYIALWIVIFGLMGAYLIGKIKFSHDSDMPFLKVPRLMFAILTFSFVIYLIPGLFGSPLKLLAGYLPPMSTHEFNLMGAINGEEGITCVESPKYSDKLHLPHGIKGYFDYEEAVACAKAQEKPLFIDFTGHGCVNCRKMEASVWSDPRILKMLKEDFVVVALYCDDKKIMLPEDEWVTSKVDGRVKKTLGSKNLDFQICTFGNNAQPLYVLLDNEEELCADYVSTLDYDKDAFYEHLKKGLDTFNKRKLTK